MQLSKPVIFVVISFLVVALIYSQFSEFAQGKPSSGTYFDCKVADFISEICCWWEDFGEGEGRYSSYVCQECVDRDGFPGYEDCGPLKKTDTRDREEPPPTSSPLGPFAPLQDGVLEQPSISRPLGPFAPLREGTVLDQQQPPTDQGAAIPTQPFTKDPEAAIPTQPATEETQPATVEEEPVPPCTEGQVIDEETGLCVVEQQEEAVQEEPQADDEEQTSDQGSEDDNSNN